MARKSFHFLRKLYIAIGLIAANLLFGIIGFMVIEHYNFGEALYETIIVLSTVGLSLIHDLSTPGRWFVIILIIISIGIFAYAVSVVTSYVMEGELQRYLKLRKVHKAINQLKGHVIVCGYGRNGKQACDQLRSHKQSFVAIESNTPIIAEMRDTDGMLFIEGTKR